jgi:hypothetical protein
MGVNGRLQWTAKRETVVHDHAGIVPNLRLTWRLKDQVCYKISKKRSGFKNMQAALITPAKRWVIFVILIKLYFNRARSLSYAIIYVWRCHNTCREIHAILFLLNGTNYSYRMFLLLTDNLGQTHHLVSIIFTFVTEWEMDGRTEQTHKQTPVANRLLKNGALINAFIHELFIIIIIIIIIIIV